MDNVLVNFVGGYCEAFGIDYDELMCRWPDGQWSMSEVLGISREAFGDQIDSKGAEFWANLKPYPHADKLWDLCKFFGEVSICSKPISPQCVCGKLQWLNKWRKVKNFEEYIFTPNKYMCSRLDRILIDDREDVVDEFCRHGGLGIVFPSFTNKLYHLKDDPVKYVRDNLKKICNGDK